VAYADVGAVKARAGVLASAWSADSSPSDSDLADFLDQTAGEIDAILGARGLGTPATGDAATALTGLNADAALVLALSASYPESSGPASALQIIADARARVIAASKALVDGTHPAMLLLESGAVSSRATSFWEQEPLYGEFFTDPNLTSPFSPDANPHTAPRLSRGQSF
jgi:hypothetical protein